MKKNVVDLVVVLDKSGSMSKLTDDTIGGFNTLIEEQKQENEGQVCVTTILFNDNIKLVHNAVPIKDVEPLTTKEYVTGGFTALYDAVGFGIKIEDERVLKLVRQGKKAPQKTLIVIITDGYENASIEYDYREIRRLIEKRKEQGVCFMFIGADIDSDEFAENIGIGRDYAYTVEKSSKGVRDTMHDISIMCCMMRTPIKIDKAQENIKKFVEERKKNIK